MVIYLSRSIDLNLEDVTAIKQELTMRGHAFFDPAEGWQARGCNIKDAASVMDINMRLIDLSDAVLVIFTMPTVGVPMEIYKAAMSGKRVAMIDRDGRASEFLALHATVNRGIHQDPAQAITALERRDRAHGLVERPAEVADLPLPAQRIDGDIGLDLYTAEDVTVPAHEWRGIPTKIRVAPPQGIWFMIMGRSSALHARGLLVVPSVIDEGFRGDLFAMAFNITDSDAHVARGERIAQLIPMHNIPFEFTEATRLPQSARAAQGFGSTGR